MAKAYRKRVLGRGLSAILSDDENNRFNNSDSSISFNEISVDSIDLNPFQPRTNFNKKDIDNLASSIKVLGLIQPITVKVDNDRYELISGERRLRAFKLLKINNIPAYVRKADDQASLEMALVENIQRKDLDPIEIAISYSRLIDELNISQEDMSKRVGKDRSTISNYIRLLRLDPIIQSGIRDSFISMGHGRTLINIDSKEKQLIIYEKILRSGLSVRQTEKIVKDLNQKKKKKEFSRNDGSFEKKIKILQKKYNLIIDLKLKNEKGHLSFKFDSISQLNKLIKKLDE
ncbi:MAG: ParB/RepB/Spo0J family partition protein [Cryomorphaceae bacterium]|nr:MAG: ParB/RepB/Spo0J family partition protein [Cryomorphaceae bacterium]